MEVYLIKSLWLDRWENRVSDAMGYKTVGFVITEDQAKEICKKGGVSTKKDCWTIQYDTPNLIYEKLNYYETNT